MRSRIEPMTTGVEEPVLGGIATLRIPMMSISHSELMPIRSERSDAGLS
jgi:hypothetical protein